MPKSIVSILSLWYRRSNWRTLTQIFEESQPCCPRQKGAGVFSLDPASMDRKSAFPFQKQQLMHRIARIARVMKPIPVAEIHTVSLLYKVKKLVPAIPEEDVKLPTPSQSFNDRIGLIRGDITKLAVDVIVNAANNSLLGGGGVDGAIHDAAGDDLYKVCKTLGGCDTGSAKITGAYLLPSQKVIHAVGPVFHRYGDLEKSAMLLASCYATSLKLAVENECKSIAFSALSTGIYGYPSAMAAPVAIRAVKEFLEGEDGDKLEKVIFCTFVQKDVDAYNHWLPYVLFPMLVHPD